MTQTRTLLSIMISSQVPYEEILYLDRFLFDNCCAHCLHSLCFFGNRFWVRQEETVPAARFERKKVGGELFHPLLHIGMCIAYRTGHTLRFDAKTETCIGDAEANRLL